MDREALPPDSDPLALAAALSELCRALASLRERLGPEVPGSESPAASRDLPHPPADADRRVLAIVHELLAGSPPDLPPSGLFAVALDRAARWLGADRAMLFVAEDRGARLIPRAARGFRREDLGATVVRPGEGIIGRVFTERRLLTRGTADGGPPDSFIERYPVCQAMAVPVRGEDAVAGVLYVGRRREAPFNASDALLLIVIADGVREALVGQAALDRRARQMARLAELGRLAAELLGGRPPVDALDALCEAGRRIGEVPAAAVAIEVGPGELELVAARGLPLPRDGGGRISSREGLMAELHGGGDVVSCRDVQARRPPDRSFLGLGGFRGCLLVPLRLDDDAAVMGALCLVDHEEREFTPEEIEAARVLARLATAAVGSNRAGREGGGALSLGGPLTGDRLAQIETTRALGEMASGLARELNNIFAVILGKSRLLLARTINEPLREGLAALEEAAWRGADVVHRMMALATPVPDALASPVDLAALVRDVLALTEPRWKEEAEGPGAGIDVVIDVRSAGPVRGSEPALREMLVNLVMNAVDAMAGGGRLTLATRPLEDGVELVVEDTGEGIKEEVRARVFDAFFTTRSPRRMGLGLTVAQGVVVRHRGWIDLAGAPEGGTRVRVWLPLAEAAPAVSPQVMAPGSPAP
jgi:signal transduction histidine kinase